MTCCVLQQYSGIADLYLVRALAEIATNMEEHHRQLFVGQLSHVIGRLRRRPQEPEPARVAEGQQHPLPNRFG